MRQLLEMIRFSHTLFALPFALLAAAMAWSANARGDAADRAAAGGRSAGHPGVHGHGPQRGDGLQPPGRSAARRAESADADAAPAAGALARGSVALFTARLRAGLRGRHAAVPAAQPAPAAGRRCRCWCFCSATATPSGSRCWSHFWLGAALMLAPLAAWVAHARRNWPGRRWCWARPCCCGWPAST